MVSHYLIRYVFIPEECRAPSFSDMYFVVGSDLFSKMLWTAHAVKLIPANFSMALKYRNGKQVPASPPLRTSFLMSLWIQS
jgi:hypothetical protein